MVELKELERLAQRADNTSTLMSTPEVHLDARMNLGRQHQAILSLISEHRKLRERAEALEADQEPLLMKLCDVVHVACEQGFPDTVDRKRWIAEARQTLGDSHE